MKGRKKWLALVLAFMLVFVVSCGDDDNDTTSPSMPADVAGNWAFAGSVTSNDCTWLQSIAVGTTGTQGVTITQNGAALNATSTGGGGAFFGPGWQFTGTATPNTFDLSLIDAVSDSAGPCDYSLGGGMRATDISGNSSPGQVFYAISGLAGTCAGQQCAVMMTGTWTKQ